MKRLHILLLCIAISGLALEAAHASDEDLLLGQLPPPQEQTMGRGQSVLWTLPNVAAQYQPPQPTPAMRQAMQAQNEGRYLDALLALDGAANDNPAEIALLRASFLLQGSQSVQALEALDPWFGDSRYASEAHALAAMAQLQQGLIQQALEAAQRGHADETGGLLPHLALSYALQGAGRLGEARDTMREFNRREPQQAVALAREAELALTLDQVSSARMLAVQAEELDPAHPYVVSVTGLVHLIDGHTGDAKTAFESALRRDPKDAKALLGLGLAEIKLGSFRDGLKKLQVADEAEPGNALILTYLGRAQQREGQLGAAKASWRSAQQADPRDPAPWLYQAQAELQANRPLDARASLREAQARAAYRAVYRGKRLLREDEQLLQANLAEIRRQLGLEDLAFSELSAAPGEQSAASLRNQADLLQGRRFGESARRSLLLQSLFDEQSGNLPSELDIYGDGAGQTGASTPQHGVVSGLHAQQASYNSYDALFAPRATLAADAAADSRHGSGQQLRIGAGGDTLGLGIALRRYKTGGFADFDGLDNRIGQIALQWRPVRATQIFLSHQNFDSLRGETFYPADPWFGANAMIDDSSRVTRAGLRHELADNSEVRGLWSYQQTAQIIDYYDFSVPPNYLFQQSATGNMHSAELQYRRSGTDHAVQWGLHQMQGQTIFPGASDITLYARQVYGAWQRTPGPHWRLEAGLGWGSIENRDNLQAFTDNSTRLARWLPRLGALYAPDEATHLRLAAWQDLGMGGVGDATLAPATLAGIALARPGEGGKLVQALALGGDRQLHPGWLLAAEAQRRNTGNPTIDSLVQAQILHWRQIDEFQLALHWQPEMQSWGTSLVAENEHIQNPSKGTALDSVDRQSLRSLQLSLRWLAATRWTANLTLSHNRVSGEQTSLVTPVIPYEDSFNQADAGLDWQFAGPRGSLAAGVRNAAGTRFTYADPDRLNPRFSAGRLAYIKLKLAW